MSESERLALLQMVEIIALSSALEQTKLYEQRCRRRANQANTELQDAINSSILKANELEAARRNWLRNVT